MNGVNEEAEKTLDDSKSVDALALIDQGVSQTIATRVAEVIRKTNLKFSDVDSVVVKLLTTRSEGDIMEALKVFEGSLKVFVRNMHDFLCGHLKTARHFDAQEAASRALSGTLDKETFLALYLKRTGKLAVNTPGQRKIGPPPDVPLSSLPKPGSEIYCGGLPITFQDHDILPHFVKAGNVYEFRLMMNPDTPGLSKRFCFVTFESPEEAKAAIQTFAGYVMGDSVMKASLTKPNLRVYVGGIPKHKDKEEILKEFKEHFPHVTDVIIYPDVAGGRKNRGFAFLEFAAHVSASIAMKAMNNGRALPFNLQVCAEWAEAQDEPDEEVMKTVKVLYVKFDASLDEAEIKAAFEKFGNIGRLKMFNNYAFVHFDSREDALKGMAEMNGKYVSGATLTVTLAKPPSSNRGAAGGGGRGGGARVFAVSGSQRWTGRSRNAGWPRERRRADEAARV